MKGQHYLVDVMHMTPINRAAAKVTSQKGCHQDSSMSRDEVIEISSRLKRKHRLLRFVLGIDTKAKHVNLVYKAKKGFFTRRGKKNPRAVSEYLLVGEQMQRLQKELGEMRRARHLDWLARNSKASRN